MLRDVIINNKKREKQLKEMWSGKIKEGKAIYIKNNGQPGQRSKRKIHARMIRSMKGKIKYITKTRIIRSSYIFYFFFKYIYII